MKTIIFALALVCAQMASAEITMRVLAPGEDYLTSIKLDMSGTYEKGTSTVHSGYRGGKSCRADHGRYLGRGRCVITNVTASIKLEKSEISDAYKVDMKSANSAQQVSTFTGVGAQINRVQLVTPITDQCNLLVLFTNDQTLSTQLAGNCGEDEKASLQINNLVRRK